MQTYKKSIASGKSDNFSVRADLFVYESGVSLGDNRVRVRPETGGDIILRAGQQFRFPEIIQNWTIEAADGTSAIDGSFILGTGAFTDSNPTNKIQLDTTFPANTVVTNQTNGLTTIAQVAPVTVGTVRVAAVADATLKRVIFRNASATGSIALGDTSVTVANAAIVLGAGDVWIEDNAAGAAWFAIADTAGLTLQISTAK